MEQACNTAHALRLSIHPAAPQMKPLEILALLLVLRLEDTIGVAVNASTDLQATQMFTGLITDAGCR